MAKKAIRTPAQQEYRNNLAKKLHILRGQWEEWKKVANDLYKTLQDNSKYIEAKGQSLDKLFDEAEKSYENPWDFVSTVAVLHKALRGNKTELTQKQKEIIKKIIRFSFNEYTEKYRKRFQGSPREDITWNTIAIEFFSQNFDILTQEEREEFILDAIKDVDITVRAYNNPGSGVGWFSRVYDQTWEYHHKPTWIMSNWTDYYFSSKWSIKSMVEKILADSNNEKFIFAMLPYLAKKNRFFDIPENCKVIYSDWEKFKNFIASENSKLDEKRRENEEDRKKSIYWSLDEERYTAVRTHDVFPFFNNLWITITWDIADLLWDKPYYSDYGSKEWIRELSEKIIQKESVKTALNEKMENLKKEDLEKFRKYFSSEYIWKLLDDKYKMPEFVNSHIEALEPILGHGWVKALVKEFWRITKWKELADSEKFNRSVFKSYIDYNPEPEELNWIWKSTNLTTLNSVDFGLASHWLYSFVEKEWLLGTDYLDDVLKWHKYPGTHSVYYMIKAKWEISKDFLEKVLDNNERYAKWKILSTEEAAAFMQDVYATQDENLIKKLFNQIWYFEKYCSEEDINVLIRKMIKAISSQEDFAIFMKEMDNHAYDEKFSMFLKIKYLLTNSLNTYKIKEHNTKIPSDIYSSLFASGVIDVNSDFHQLPKVYQNVSPFVDPDDLDKLSNYYSEMLENERQASEKREQEEEERNERLRKEREENERIYNEAVENREKWEIVFDNYVKNSIFHGQKYVLSVDRENHILKFITAPMDKFPYHSNLHSKYIEDGRCLGWGLIDKNDEKKVITLRWHSESYWSVLWKDKEAMKKMLEKRFPDYKIIA